MIYCLVNITHNKTHPFKYRVEEEHQVSRSTQAEEDALEMQVGGVFQIPNVSVLGNGLCTLNRPFECKMHLMRT